MKRWVSVTRGANGATTATVSLVDGDLSSKYAVKTYTGEVGKAVKAADAAARRNLEDLKAGLEEC